MPIPRHPQALYWLWLFAIGFGALALLGGTMPPGILWPAEGNGYDVLEYHFGAPRDYIDAGRVSYLPHNIYSNFPFNVEMLYLLTMILLGDPIRAVYTAKLLNVCLGMLAVGGVWLAGREFGRRSGIISGLLAASCPFMVYLSGVAYVENGLVFFSALSLAAFLRSLRDLKRSRRWMIVSGLLGGLACGCKYTAVPAVAVPMAVAAFVVALLSKQDRRPIRMLLLYCVGCLITFGPWLAKNAVATGNPVFPLGCSVFGTRPGIWYEGGAARWREGHRPAPEDRSASRRMSRIWHEVIGSTLFGPMIGVGLIAGIILVVIGARLRTNLRTAYQPRPPPESEAIGDSPGDGSLRLGGLIICGIMIVMGLVTWTAFSHLVGRFAIVLVVPCSLLSGIAWNALRASTAKRIAALILLAILSWNLTVTWRLFADSKIDYLELNLFGQTQWIIDGTLPGTSHIARLNETAKTLRGSGTPSRILMVGDARRFFLPCEIDYCVVFNRNPFAEAADRASVEQLLHWLDEQGYAFIYVDWSEMNRLRNSRYGFWQSVTVDLFERLTQSGIRPVEHFRMTKDRPPYATLFSLPPAASRSR